MTDNGLDIETLRQWTGREETAQATITPDPCDRMAATLESANLDLTEGSPLPALWHWMYFLPTARASDIAIDGHPSKGGFLPPVPLLRRMWAGSRIMYHDEFRIGAEATRKSIIKDIEQKSQGLDAKIFVTVRHEFSTAGSLCLVEEQDIVYRHPPLVRSSAAKPLPAPAKAEWSQTIVPSPVLLFRYSALTFNAHRIHYDRSYACATEGYPGLVVHGPLTATLLMALLKRNAPDFAIRKIAIRALKPLFDLHAFELQGCGDQERATLWALDHEAAACLQIEVLAS
ncbi:MAG: acyl-CoA dehydrogenase [Gammaproteobacteria bacterium]|nr:acyl-CoA dehydrogenase [Gammaproteobacteria bacterium]